LTALVLGGDGVAIYHGLYGFNAVLTGIALGGLFLVLKWRSTIYALIGVIFSAIVFAAIVVALAPIGMPAFTPRSCSRPGCSCCRWPVSEHWSGSRSPSAPRQAPWSGCAPRS